MTENGQVCIDEMKRSYFESNYEIRTVLRTLFNSSYFKSEEARYARVKGPVELVVGAVRTAGSYTKPTLGVDDVAQQAFFMGQGLLNPPTVEGWHEGDEWIDSGALVERVNFVANELSNPDQPGVRTIINRLTENNESGVTAEQLVDDCLEAMGSLDVSPDTLNVLHDHVAGIEKATDDKNELGSRIAELLGLIGASREYQLA